MIICNRDIIKRDGVYGAPDLIVEVLSPFTARRDRGDKKTLYEQHGVQEYDVYTVIPDGDWEEMTEEEKSEVALNLKVSLYDDFIINVKDVFENVITY